MQLEHLDQFEPLVVVLGMFVPLVAMLEVNYLVALLVLVQIVVLEQMLEQILQVTIVAVVG